MCLSLARPPLTPTYPPPKSNRTTAAAKQSRGGANQRAAAQPRALHVSTHALARGDLARISSRNKSVVRRAVVRPKGDPLLQDALKIR